MEDLDNVCDLVWETDPRIVGMLREFMYRYVGEVLKDGQVFAEYRVSAPPGARYEHTSDEHGAGHHGGRDQTKIV